MPCKICGATRQTPLPIPAPGRSLLSDGRVIFRDLAKVSCDSCGAVSHTFPLTNDELSGLFEADYALPGLSPKADAQRARSYADWILEVVGRRPISSMIEIGCGSGSLIATLADALKAERAVGFDPAMLQERGTSTDPLWLFRGSIEHINERDKFDLAVSVNVVEHVADPVKLIRTIASHVTRDGQLVVICPSDKPSTELLFLDHVTTFSAAAMQHVARAAGCHVAGTLAAPGHIGDFQLFIIKHGEERIAITQPSVSTSEIGRFQCIEAWRNLDQYLVCKIESVSEVAVFGATEAASLLRAYAPQFWDKVTFLTVDDCSEAWPLDRPVSPYADLAPKMDRTLVIAVRPGRQSPVSERLTKDRHRSLVWDDYITSRAMESAKPVGLYPGS